MFNSKKARIISTVVYLLLSTFVNAKEKTYKIATVGWIGWSGAQVAEAKGFWKEEKISVKTFCLPSNQAMNKALLEKRIDIQFDMLGTAVGLYMNGIPVTIICETNWSNGGDKIVLKNNIKLSDVKRVGTYLDMPSVNYFLDKYLKQNNTSLFKYKTIAIEPKKMTEFFIRGNLDIIVSYDPPATNAMNNGDGNIVATSADYKGCIPEGMFMLDDSYKNISKRDLKKIIKGYVKAANWLNNPKNWEEYQTILNNKTFPNDKPFSTQELKEMIDGVKIHNASELLERNKKNGKTKQYFINLKKFLKDNGRLKKDFKVDDIFDSKITMEALEEYQKNKGRE